MAAEIVIEAESQHVGLHEISTEMKRKFDAASNEIVSALVAMMEKVLIAR